MRGIGFESLSVSSSAVGFTEANYQNSRGRANYVLMKCTSGAVRVRFDATNPTASVGFPLSSGDSMALAVDPGSLKVIRQSADSTVEALFCKQGG